jgi:hypothetical protein
MVFLGVSTHFRSEEGIENLGDMPPNFLAELRLATDSIPAGARANWY